MQSSNQHFLHCILQDHIWFSTWMEAMIMNTDWIDSMIRLTSSKFLTFLKMIAWQNVQLANDFVRHFFICETLLPNAVLRIAWAIIAPSKDYGQRTHFWWFARKQKRFCQIKRQLNQFLEEEIICTNRKLTSSSDSIKLLHIFPSNYSTYWIL